MSKTSRAQVRDADRPRSQMFTGVYRRMEGARAVVTLQDRDVTIPATGLVQPVPDSTVNVELRDSGYVMLGPVKPPPTRGRVTATGTPTITVVADGVTYEIPYMSAYTPAIDDDVAVEWSEAGGLVKGRVSTTPTVAPVEAAPTPVDGYHPSPFLASAAGYHVLSTGVFNGSYYPLYGDSPTAGLQASAAWYGSTVADSIPDGATVTSARLYLSVRSTSYGGPKLQVIEGAGPQGRVQVGGDFALPARSGWVPIPVEVVDLLKVAPRGLSTLDAVGGSGSDVYNKLTADPQSFALDIAWSVGGEFAT